MEALRNSRPRFNGAVTKIAGRLNHIKADEAAAISVIDPNFINVQLKSLEKTETKFQENLEAAQEYAPEDEDEYDTFLEAESKASDAFQEAVFKTRETAHHLLALKQIQRGLADLTFDIDVLEKSLATKPDCDHSSRCSSIDSCFIELRQTWRRENLPAVHPLKAELDACIVKIDTLTADSATAKHRATSTISSSAATLKTAPHRIIELPKIKVPTFNGELMSWSTFWSTFKATVDDREELTESQKLNYLRQSITDPTLQLLLTTPMETADTYQNIITELKERFQKTREIHQVLVKTIVTARTPKYTRADLRMSYDIFTTSMANLKATKFNNLESFLSSHFYSLLPPKLQLAWDQATRKDKGVPPVDQLLEFMKEHAETLPADSQPTKPQPAASKGANNSRSNQPAAAKGSNPVNVVAPAPSKPPEYEYKWECTLCAPERHPLRSCPKWVNLNLLQKTAHIAQHNCCSNCLGIGHTTANCKSHWRCAVCKQKHHSSMHQQPAPSLSVNSLSPGRQVPDVLLTTAELVLIGPNGEEMESRALIDSGAGISLVTSKVTELLNLPLETTDLRLTVAQGTVTKPLKHLTTLTLSPRHNRGLKMTCVPAVTDTVTATIPAQHVSPEVTDLQHLIGLQLADPKFNRPGYIDIILGADMLPSIVSETERPRKGKTSEPLALATVFGWALAGPVPGFTRSADAVPTYCLLPRVQCEPTPPQEPTLDTLLHAILQEEEGPKEEESSTQEEAAEQHFQATTKYLVDEQRYEVSLPKRDNIGQLGESKPQAMARYRHTTQAAQKKNIEQQFQEGIASYIQLGHAEEVPPEEQPPPLAFWLPMHSVLKLSSSSTKLRVVFDGSAATTSGLSLNQALHVGPTIQATLSDTLLKFRTYPIALNADISKMYREVKLCTADKDLHRFVWRENPASSIKDYRMTRVTFGVSASPFLAIRTLHQTADDHGEDYPKATQHIKDSFYVDDFLGGANNVEEAIQLFHDLRTVLEKGGFDLRKWRSSSPNVLSHIPADLHEVDPLKTSTATHVSTHSKALGLRWDSTSDVMSPAISSDNLTSPTRRGLVSAVFKTYDVLGWIAPTLLQMKLLIQGLWKSTKGWDDLVPEKAIKAYLDWEKELPILAEKTLPRQYTDVNPITISLHGFADASKAAYGAVIYCRATYNYRTPTVSLVTSKTKLVKQETKKKKDISDTGDESEPTKLEKKDTSDPEEEESEEKPETIPKLELCAALLLAKLLSKVGNVLKIEPSHWHAWSDASTVLAWLDGNKRNHPVYVANRVKKTLELTQPKHWLHVPGEDNPADCASRGVSPTALANLTLWWEGPPWLQEEPIPIPHQPPRKPLPDGELPIMVIVPYHSMANDISDLPHTYPHLVAITAWCRRFCDRIKLGRPNPDSRTKHLTGRERRDAEMWLLKEAQRRCFPEDIKRLSKKEQLARDSRLKSLNPFLDNEQIIRVGGRLSNADLPASQAKPIIADAKDTLMVKFLEHLHRALLHCGPSHLLAYSGTKRHILGARKLTRKICSTCVTCRTYHPRTQHQLMADLPSQRVNASPPFTHCGMDFAGPFQLKMGYVRKPTILLAHICIFICLSTKAIHLEVTTAQSTEAFEAALQRFVARRGCPQHLYSDNGGGFIGARNRYHQLLSILQDQKGEDDIRHFLATQHNIVWHNIPAFSPHMGGLWEAAVKSMKRQLRRVMGTRRFTLEELITVTCRIEA